MVSDTIMAATKAPYILASGGWYREATIEKNNMICRVHCSNDKVRIQLIRVEKEINAGKEYFRADTRPCELDWFTKSILSEKITHDILNSADVRLALRKLEQSNIQI